MCKMVCVWDPSVRMGPEQCKKKKKRHSFLKRDGGTFKMKHRLDTFTLSAQNN